MPPSERPLPDDEPRLRALKFVEQNYERIGYRASARFNTARFGLNPGEVCERLRDVTIEKILDGTYDPTRDSLEQYMYAIAALLLLSMSREAARRNQAHQQAAIDRMEDIDQSFIRSAMDDSPSVLMDQDDIAIRNILERNLAFRRDSWDEAIDEALERNFGRAREIVQRVALGDVFENCRAQDRLLIYRHYWQEQTIQDLAAEFGITVDCLYKRHSRVKEQVRSRFVDLCGNISIPIE